MTSFADVLSIYEASNADATRALYADLERLGAMGTIAVNLFRAQKASQRAKVYRGGNGHGSYRSQAYGKKQWSMDQLAAALTAHGRDFDLRWGWQEDAAQPFHIWVLYVDLPEGQVSFHTADRGQGPDYPHPWDRAHGMGPARICRFVARLLDGVPA